MGDTWERTIKFVLDYEGRYYENNPMDLGGETKFGISQKSYPHEDIRHMTEERAKEIYRRDYWDPLRCDELPEKIAIAAFDCAVNQGVGRAARVLQAVLNVETDGKIGPMTIAAAQVAGDDAVWMFLLHRARLYMTTRTVEYWGGNWGNRLILLADFIFKK